MTDRLAYGERLQEAVEHVVARTHEWAEWADVEPAVLARKVLDSLLDGGAVESIEAIGVIEAARWVKNPPPELTAALALYDERKG